jgi:GT2 family glycosyltransferase
VKVVALIVSYGTPDLASGLVEDLLSSAKEPGLNDEIICIVVENDRQSELFLGLSRKGNGPKVYSVASARNDGYLGGARVAREVGQLVGMFDDPVDWWLICNSDLRVCKGGDLFGGLRAAGDAGLVGPRIKEGMRELNPYLKDRPSVGWMRRREFLFRYSVIAWLYMAMARVKAFGQRLVLGNRAPMDQQTVYAVHGSAFFVSDSRMPVADVLNYPGFLFGEEIYVAEMARRVGTRACVEARICFEHSGHVSTGTRRRGVLAQAQVEGTRLARRVIQGSD